MEVLSHIDKALKPLTLGKIKIYLLIFSLNRTFVPKYNIKVKRLDYE